MARVLVIEDDATLRHLMQLILEAKGHEVWTADDGSRGFAIAGRQAPDVIILDLMMPFMDGFTVLESLQHDERTAQVPVLVLSAMHGEDIQGRCFQLNAKQYLQKPFDADVLLGVVEEMVSDRADAAAVGVVESLPLAT
jgi:two-component system response regulator RpaA